MARVRLENVGRQFGSSFAIRDITFDVPDGAFWVLVGPSGCGKSTVLRTIAGLEPISQGQLYIDEMLMNSIPARQRDVAMVFQNYALYPHMTVAQNLAFGLRMRQVAPDLMQERVHTVARSLDIAHLMDRRPGQLSGGQQQRVALGRAIARQPRLFLLDEPLSNLDAQLRDDTRAELKRLHHQFGITTLYVTHDQVEAMTLADQIVVLHQGKIQQIGSPQALYARPANRMVAAFLGSPPMNILEARFDGQHFWVDSQALPCPDGMRQTDHLVAGQLYHLGLRPEHLHLATDDQDSHHLKVQVTVVEPLGRETLILAEVPNRDRTVPQTIQFPAPATVNPAPGECLPLMFDAEQLFVFNPTTGETFYPTLREKHFH